MAYFTPTVLPMIAVANIWLFFYTPQYGLLAQVLAVFGGSSQNWLGSKDTALACVTIVAIWKEAGFFMIFYLAALQQIPPSLGEAAALEGASRWHFFRRVQFPLLMPTTLFVLVNAVINAFRMVDHMIVMTRGGPDNATSLLLFRVYELGFNFWDTGLAAAMTWFSCSVSPRSRSPSTSSSKSGSTTGEHAGHKRSLCAARGDPADRDRCRLAARHLWILPLLYAVWTAFHPTEYSARFEAWPRSPSTTSPGRGSPLPSRATSSTRFCW